MLEYNSTSLGPDRVALYANIVGSAYNGELSVSNSQTTPAYHGDTWILHRQYSTTGDKAKWPRRCVISQYLNVGDIIGIANNFADFEAETHLRAHEPIQIGWNSAVDLTKYGSLFSAFNFLKKDYDSQHLEEHQVLHMTYQGVVEDSFGAHVVYSVLDNGTIEVIDGVANPRPTDRVTYVGVTDGQRRFSSGLSTTVDVRENIHPTRTLLGFIAGQEALFPSLPVRAGIPGHYYTNGSMHYHIEEFNNSSSEANGVTFIKCSYVFATYQHGFWGGSTKLSIVKWRVDVNFVVYFQSYFSNSPLPGAKLVHPDIIHIDNHSTVKCIMSEWTGGGSSGSYDPAPATYYVGCSKQLDGSLPLVDKQNAILFWTKPRHQQARPPMSNLTNYQSRGTFEDEWWKRHVHFREFCDHVYNDPRGLIPSSFYSASDALQNSVEILSANHLENLLNIAQVLQTLPNIAAISRLLAKILRGDLSSIPLLIDVVTDHILKIRFGIQPAAGDVEELLTTDLLPSLQQLLKVSYTTIYGSFSYTFSQDELSYGEGSLTLKTRSKCRIRMDMTTVMASFLTLNGIGLAPTLSNIWDTVPFSFVVDWFTNMDDRLEAIDNQLLWLAMYTHFCVHSYTIVYTPTFDELDQFGLFSPNPSRPFQLKWYRRDYTLHPPRLIDARFDYKRQSHSPDPVTVGSFMFQQGS